MTRGVQETKAVYRKTTFPGKEQENAKKRKTKHGGSRKSWAKDKVKEALVEQSSTADQDESEPKMIQKESVGTVGKKKRKRKRNKKNKQIKVEQSDSVNDLIDHTSSENNIIYQDSCANSHLIDKGSDVKRHPTQIQQESDKKTTIEQESERNHD